MRGVNDHGSAIEDERRIMHASQSGRRIKTRGSRRENEHKLVAPQRFLLEVSEIVGLARQTHENSIEKARPQVVEQRLSSALIIRNSARGCCRINACKRKAQSPHFHAVRNQREQAHVSRIHQAVKLRVPCRAHR